MRSLATVLVLALGLWSCGGNVNTTPATPELQPLSLTGPATNIYPFTSANSVATVGSQPVLPLFAISEPTNQGTAGVAFWGTKNASTGVIGALVEAEVYGVGTPPSEAHIYFNAAQQASLIRDDTTGYSITLNYPNTSSLVVTLCDPSYNAVSQATWTLGATTGSVSSGGSCILSLVPTSAASSGQTTVVTNLSNLSALAPVLNGATYASTLYSVLSAMSGFQEHKDNPTQNPVGTPLTLLFIGAALLFLPSVLSVTGQTMFDVTNTPAINGLLPGYQTEP